MMHPFFNLPYEMLNHIADFLTIKEKYILKHSNKYLRENISIRIDDFNIKLEKIIDIAIHVPIGKKIIDIIKEYGGLIKIGGSSILQCIHSELYDTYDIDIYIDCHEIINHIDLLNTLYNDKINSESEVIINDENLCKYINIAGKECIMNYELIQKFDCIKAYDKLLKLLGENDMVYNDNAIDNYSFTGSITNMYHKNNNKNKIQIIMITKKYMDIPYDFTFCKNIYDGKNVVSLNIQDVVNKKGKLNKWRLLNCCDTELRQCAEIKNQEIIMNRMIKYIDRGYKINNLYKRYDCIDPKVKNIYNKSYCLRNNNINILDLPNKLIRYISKYMYISEKKKFKHTCKHINYVVKIDLKMVDRLIINKINTITYSRIGGKLCDYIKCSNNNIILCGNVIDQCLNPHSNESTYIDIYVTYNKMYRIDENKKIAALLCQIYTSKIVNLIISGTQFEIDWNESCWHETIDDGYTIKFAMSEKTSSGEFMNGKLVYGDYLGLIIKIMMVPNDHDLDIIIPHYNRYDSSGIYF